VVDGNTYVYIDMLMWKIPQNIVVFKDASTLAPAHTSRDKCGQFREPRPNERESQESRL
jgi:hypothetical protein